MLLVDEWDPALAIRASNALIRLGGTAMKSALLEYVRIHGIIMDRMVSLDPGTSPWTAVMCAMNPPPRGWWPTAMDEQRPVFPPVTVWRGVPLLLHSALGGSGYYWPFGIPDARWVSEHCTARESENVPPDHPLAEADPLLASGQVPKGFPQDDAVIHRRILRQLLRMVDPPFRPSPACVPSVAVDGLDWRGVWPTICEEYSKLGITWDRGAQRYVARGRRPARRPMT
jgi:hypothetical protein